LTEAADTEAKPGVVGRWRATLAHESAHILLHRMLFELNGNGQSKTSADTSSGGHDAVMQCLKRDVGPGGRSSDWREVQANRGMAALLMPQRIFSKVAQAKIDETNLTELTPGSQSSRILAQQLAHHFSVSKQAASIRLETLSLISSSN
jgi:Zn-dependent peptidase ImmA (M78 family)